MALSRHEFFSAIPNIVGVRRDRTRRRYGAHNMPRQKSFFKRAVLVALLVVLLLGLAAGAQLRRALPPARVSVVLPGRVAAPGSMSSLPWPSKAAAAVEIEGIASLGGVRRTQIVVRTGGQGFDQADPRLADKLVRPLRSGNGEAMPR